MPRDTHTRSGQVTLKAYLANRAAAAKGCLSVPGVWDGLSSTLASRAGFDVQFLSGAALTMSRMGLPDLGFLDLATLVDATARIADATGAMLIVDADTGFGNAIHARRAVRSLESAGATAIQIEDQTYPKLRRQALRARRAGCAGVLAGPRR